MARPLTDLGLNIFEWMAERGDVRFLCCAAVLNKEHRAAAEAAWARLPAPLAEEDAIKLADALIIDTCRGHEVNDERVEKIVRLSRRSLAQLGVLRTCEGCKEEQIPIWNWDGGSLQVPGGCAQCELEGNESPMWLCYACEKYSSINGMGVGEKCSGCRGLYHEQCAPLCDGCRFLEGCNADCCNCAEEFGQRDFFDDEEFYDEYGWYP